MYHLPRGARAEEAYTRGWPETIETLSTNTPSKSSVFFDPIRDV
jgi:hypothetical protein